MTRTKYFVRYLIVGGLAYLLEMAIIFILTRVFGLSAVISVSVSYWTGFVAAFLLQKYITFQNNDKTFSHLSRAVIWYAVLNLWNFVFTILIVRTFSDDFSAFFLRTVAIAITTVWNFWMYNHVFKKKSLVK